MLARLAPRAVLRSAAWPIETVDSFAAPDLARSAEDLLARERAVLDRRAELESILHAVVPTIEERACRRYVLAVKRHVHGETSPLPAAPAHLPRRLDPEVARLIAAEDAQRRALLDARTDFYMAHRQTLAQQLAALREVTATQAFQRALLIANPAVARAWRESRPRQPKRQRHLETTVFHYLMRACGRATPNGAWAGVAPVTLSEVPSSSSPLTVRSAPAGYRAAVSLQAFDRMLRSLSRQSRYRRQSPLHLNPTLQADPTGGWTYDEDREGVHHPRRVPGQPLVAAIVDGFADGQPRSAPPLIDALGALSPDPALRAGLERLLDWLVDHDVLRTPLRLPLLAPDAWTALAGVLGGLLEPERSRWRGAIARLQLACRRLEEFESLTPDEAERVLVEIETEVGGLWTAAGLEGPVPEPLVHVDMRAPFDVTWSRAGAERAARAVRAVIAFHAADGGAELFRKQSVGDVLRVLRECGGHAPALEVLERLGWSVPPRARGADLDQSDTLEFILGQMPPHSPLGLQAQAYCQRWERDLESRRGDAVFHLPERPPGRDVLPGPGGALLLRLAGDGDLWIGPGRPESALFAARFTDVLGAPALTVCVPAVGPGLSATEIVGWDPFNPNAGLHPALTEQSLGGEQLADVRLLIDPRFERVWMWHTQSAHAMAPIFASGADIGFNDARGRLLQVLTASHGWEFLSFQTPALRKERDVWQHAPRLVLASGETLRSERWIFDRAAIERLRAAADADRYTLWRQEVRSRGIPELVHVRCGPHQTEVLLRADSPLAVRCLLESYAVQAPWMEVSEAPGSPRDWPVRDASGNHYLAELGVTWFAEHYWQTAAPAARE
jgi:hypothetical protein